MEHESLNNQETAQLGIGAVIGWHFIYEKPPIENDYIELMFDNGLTTKRHWNISIYNETVMIKPVYWRACR